MKRKVLKSHYLWCLKEGRDVSWYKPQAPSSEPQASSRKRQASSNKQQAPGVTVTRSNLFTEALKLDTTKNRKI